MQDGCFIITSWSVLLLRSCDNGGLVSTKQYECFFLVDTLCQFRKHKDISGIMHRCLKCPQYERFMREMEEEEEQFFEEVERIRKFGYPKRFDVPKE